MKAIGYGARADGRLAMGIWIAAVPLILLLSIFPTTAMAAKEVTAKATVYSDSYQGKKTASGARYNKLSMTAASSTLPLGTKVLVTNKHSGHSAIVLVNDRMKSRGAKLDLSKSAAKKLGINGVGQVTSKVLK